jgi:hypothetical protein
LFRNTRIATDAQKGEELAEDGELGGPNENEAARHQYHHDMS